MTLNNLEAQDQSLGLCLVLGVYHNLLRLERWTVNPYVASSSLARGASFLDVFVHLNYLFSPTVSMFGNFAAVCCGLSSATWVYPSGA